MAQSQEALIPALRNIGLAFALTFACACGAQTTAPLALGDYDAEPRAGGHVDSDLLVRRLGDLGANTYMWLVLHSANDGHSGARSGTGMK